MPPPKTLCTCRRLSRYAWIWNPLCVLHSGVLDDAHFPLRLTRDDREFLANIGIAADR